VDGSAAPLFFLAAIAGAFWLLVLRPAKARAKAQAETVRALHAGDRILMASGMVGTIVATASGSEGDLQVEIAPGVMVTIVDQAVARVLEPQAGTDLGTATSGEVGE